MAIREFDLDFEGTTIRCYEGGSGYPLLMIHGSGPGTGSESNWMRVMGPLSRRYRICAMDLVGYGFSGLKRREPFFDTDMWVRQAKRVLNRLSKSGPVGIIGHSLGGYLALRLGAEVLRVDRILAQGSLGAKTRLNKAVDAAWTYPKSKAAFRKLFRYLTLDATDEFVKLRLAVLNRDGYGEYFSKMFKGNKQRYLDEAVLTAKEQKRLERCKILLLHGAQDDSVPFEETTLSLGALLPHADILRLANCGHPCSFDQPEKFVKAATAFFD